MHGLVLLYFLLAPFKFDLGNLYSPLFVERYWNDDLLTGLWARTRCTVTAVCVGWPSGWRGTTWSRGSQGVQSPQACRTNCSWQLRHKSSSAKVVAKLCFLYVASGEVGSGGTLICSSELNFTQWNRHPSTLTCC